MNPSLYSAEISLKTKYINGIERSHVPSTTTSDSALVGLPLFVVVPVGKMVAVVGIVVVIAMAVTAVTVRQHVTANPMAEAMGEGGDAVVQMQGGRVDGVKVLGYVVARVDGASQPAGRDQRERRDRRR